MVDDYLKKIDDACPFPPRLDPSKNRIVDSKFPGFGIDYKMILTLFLTLTILLFGVSMYIFTPLLYAHNPKPSREITVLQYQRLLSETPEKAEKLIIDKLGSEYFHKYFSLENVFVQNISDPNWFARVTYLYKICIENKTYTNKISLYFNEYAVVVSTSGIPSTNNLMPFNITESKAFEIAKDAVGNIPYKDYIIRILYNYNSKIYHWVVEFSNVTYVRYEFFYYHTGRSTRVTIDLTNGQVYEAKTIDNDLEFYERYLNNKFNING
ncbi:hypothetical protein JW865_00620 [Candidatus Bathyarchaeota archaeon]|nr:hypothetical protein [Candidatus Bathyarchaeota archaeon]